jgi:hypothetical protein
MRTNKIKPSQAELLAQAKKKANSLSLKPGPMNKMFSDINKTINERKKLVGDYYKSLSPSEAKSYKDFMNKAMETKKLLDKQPKGESIRTEIVRADNNSTIKNFEKNIKSKNK